MLNRNLSEMIFSVKKLLAKYLDQFKNFSSQQILDQRKKKFLSIGSKKRYTVFSKDEYSFSKGYGFLEMVKENAIKHKNKLIISFLAFLIILFLIK